MLSLTLFEMKLQTKGGSQVCYFDIVCFGGKGQNFLVSLLHRKERKKIMWTVVLNVCPLCNWGSDLWKINQVIALGFPVP